MQSKTSSVGPERLSPLAREIKRFTPVYSSLLIITLFCDILILTTPIYMMQVNERVLLSRNETTLLFLTVIAVFLLIVWAILQNVRRRVLQRLSTTLDQRLGSKVFKSLASANGDARRSSAEGASLMGDFNAVRDFVGSPLITAAMDCIFIPLVFVVMYVIHPWFGLAAVVFVCVVGFLSLLNQYMVSSPTQRARVHSVKELEIAGITVRNAEPIRVLGMLPGLTKRWRENHDAALGWQSYAQSRSLSITGILNFVTHSERLFLIALGAVLYLNREISQGAVYAVTLIMMRGIGPIAQLFGGWRSFVTARIAYDRLNEALGDLASEDQVSLPRPAGNVSVSRVHARPPGTDRLVLRDVTFALPAGRVLGVVGASGAGKSCLARVLVGAWQPLSGTVTLDSHDLRHWNPDELGPHLGYVPQDVEMLGGTVADNIARFRDDVDRDARVLKAAKSAGIEGLIGSLPDGYNTELGQGGHVLSGGQRQRLALARAIYGDPSLVVLDEPNSNLDAAGEEALGSAIRGLREAGASVIVVTHKMNLLVFCDDVLVMHQGAVFAHGPRDEIMSRLPSQRLAAPRPVPNALEQLAS